MSRAFVELPGGWRFEIIQQAGRLKPSARVWVAFLSRPGFGIHATGASKREAYAELVAGLRETEAFGHRDLLAALEEVEP